jgi:hypothetical protein
MPDRIYFDRVAFQEVGKAVEQTSSESPKRG